MSQNVFRSKNNIKIDNQNFIKKNLDYVGKNFIYEARSMYYKIKKSPEESMVQQAKRILRN